MDVQDTDIIYLGFLSMKPLVVVLIKVEVGVKYLVLDITLDEVYLRWFELLFILIFIDEETAEAVGLHVF